MTARFLVYQVGCIECGVSSYPIKTCKTVEDALVIAKAHPSTWETEHGEGYVTVIDLKECKTVSDHREND
jgi:hypothetical protein